jgi:acetyltransferase
MALHVITEARLKSQKGFSYYVGVGNEADIKFHEYLEKFTDDPATKAIMMYVDGMRDGRRFLQQAYRTTPKKPIVLLKGGRSIRGSKSAGSHTGALAGLSEVSRTAFKRAGIVAIENSDELFPVAEALAGLPPIRNGRIAILADGGGHATVAADVLSEEGLKIPELIKESRQKLAALLSPNASLHNPVDLAGSADSNPGLFADCARVLLSSNQIGGLLVVGLFGGYGMRFADRLRFIEEDAAHRMGKLVQETGKPIVVHSLYNFAHPHAHDLLRYYDIPVYDSVEIACKSMAALSEYGHYLGTFHRRTNFVFHWGANAKERCARTIDRAAKEHRQQLLEPEAKQLLSDHGIPVTKDRLASTAKEAEAAAARYDVPVALKICSPDISHKSDVGGVRLNLQTSGQVRKAFREIIRQAKESVPKADIQGCIVSPMVKPGTEVIVGTKIDPQFGPVIMFGIGGILVEVLKDVVFRVLPISRASAREMLHEIRSAPILNGVRGQASVDREALVDLVLAVADIIEAYPRIQEMDLNPVVLHPDGLTVVDARIVLKKNYRESIHSDI